MSARKRTAPRKRAAKRNGRKPPTAGTGPKGTAWAPLTEWEAEHTARLERERTRPKTASEAIELRAYTCGYADAMRDAARCAEARLLSGSGPAQSTAEQVEAVALISGLVSHSVRSARAVRDQLVDHAQQYRGRVRRREWIQKTERTK